MVTIHNQDCMEAMKEMSDNEFDLAIVDPPYGINRSGQRKIITKKNKHKRKYYQDKKWDNEIPNDKYFKELFRISKNQIIWGANYFVKHLQNSSMGWIFWDKGQDLTMSDGELAYTSYQKAMRRVIINRCEIQKDGSIHPTQKPVKLYEWLLINYAKKGNKILDTHLGSGSIAIACHNLGFNLTGYEIDTDYYNSALKRYKDHIKQLTLF